MNNNPRDPVWNGTIPQPIRKDGAGATDNGPRDVMRDLENPDMLVPPVTDAGSLPNIEVFLLRYSYAIKPWGLVTGSDR